MKLDKAKGALQQGNAIEGSICRCEICGGQHWTAECQATEAHAAQKVNSTLINEVNAVGGRYNPQQWYNQQWGGNQGRYQQQQNQLYYQPQQGDQQAA